MIVDPIIRIALLAFFGLLAVGGIWAIRRSWNQ